MKDVMILRELDQIKAISQEYRITILEAFNYEPATAKQISDRLGEPHAKINYHIKTLVKVNILELVQENIKLGIVEKYYCPVARDYVIDSSSLTSGDREMKTMNKVNVALFEHIAKDFYNNVEKGGNKPPKKINHLEDIYLFEDEAEEFSKTINKSIQTFIEGKRVPREGALKYSVSSLIIPEIK